MSWSKQKFSLIKHNSDDETFDIMVENDPTSGLILKNEQVGMYFMNRIWLTRPCTLSEVKCIVEEIERFKYAHHQTKSE